MSYEPGNKVGDYEILEALGAGGMGEVYKVRNVLSDRVEAMKVLLPDLASHPELAGRFLREIKVLAGLDHPNIAALRTASHVGNQLVMIMELVEGTTLAHRLRGGAFPEREAVDFIDQVLSALSYAHGRGIVHRDIKPANMMLTRSGVVKLMDFGIAHAAGESKLTQTGSTLGSIYYMSPEQVQGQNLDARSDLYSLGVSLYEMVTGLHPFEGDTSFTIMKGHIDGSPVPPREVNPNLSPALNEVVLHALAKDPDDRYQTADEYSGALQTVKQFVQPSAAPAVRAVAPSIAATTPSRPSFTPPGAQPAMASASPPAVPYTPTRGTASQPQAIAAPPPAPAAPPASVPAATIASPAQPIAPAARVATPAVAVPTHVPRSYRAFYMGLGAALILVFLVLTAMKLPVFQNSSATKPAATAPANPTPAPPPSAAAQPAAATPDNSSATTSPAPAGPTPAEIAAEKRARAAESKKQQDAAAEAQAKAEAEAKLYEEQETRFIHMSARAEAMKSSYETLRNQQAASGFSPNQDLTIAEHTMEQYLGRADAALSVHDGATAKKYMDMAEPQIAVLERKFGR